MKNCNTCHITILDNTKQCPLCHTTLIGDTTKNESQRYPKISNIKKNNFVIKLLLFLSALLLLACVIVNRIIDPELGWSSICIVGVLYIWLTTMYSIKSNVNIASHVLLQSVCVSIICIVIDAIFGWKQWSINYALPISIQAANVTMFVLLIVTHKRYLKYMIYQLILSVYSIIPIVLLNLGIVTRVMPTFISTSIAVITLIATLIFCGKAFDAEIERRFHF